MPECNGCGKEFDSQPALSGHMASCPEADANGDPDEATHVTATPGDLGAWHVGTKTDGDMRELASAVLPGQNPLGNLLVKHKGGLSYAVLSLGGDEPTFYNVRLGDPPECSCPDMKYNRADDEHNVCKHTLAAMLAPRLSTEETLSQVGIELLSRLNDAVEDAEAARDGLEEALVKAREGQAEAQPATATESTSESQETQSGGVSPQDAADRLREAYGEVVDDMQVKATDSYVWVQTGQDTPDELPGPGTTGVFDALLRNPDEVEYVPEDYGGDYPNAEAEKPGEWWKNALKPEDVDGYIEDVLGVEA